MAVMTTTRAGAEASVTEFAADLTWQALPPEVRQAAHRCLLDLVGVAAGGFSLAQSSIVRDVVLARAAAGPTLAGTAPVWFTGRQAPLADAAWVNATAIESLDAHDGHALTKGHAGVALLPGLLALYAKRPDAGVTDLLASLAAGYEIATRLGIAIHATAPDYHSSGSWNSIAVALVGAAALGGRGVTLLHAAGIAEYFAPRGPMMRCIAEPTMVKDSSGWGCRVGVEAAELALADFTGSPAELISGPVRGTAIDQAQAAAQADLLAHLWSDLGSRWRITEQYFKPYPVCRWAQPAVEAVLAVQRAHDIKPRDIAEVTIGSFAAAVSLATTRPADTEQAQYSLPFSVAAALHAGTLGAAEVSERAIADPDIQSLTDRVILVEEARHSARFPAIRRADATITLTDGSRLTIEDVGPRGDPDEPLSDAEIDAKFAGLAAPLLGTDGARWLRDGLSPASVEATTAASLAAALGRPVGQPPVLSQPASGHP
jgi:2-methylcitrate dehydratase PrpD